MQANNLHLCAAVENNITYIVIVCSFYFGHAPALAKSNQQDSKKIGGDLFLQW